LGFIRLPLFFILLFQEIPNKPKIHCKSSNFLIQTIRIQRNKHKKPHELNKPE